MRVGSGTDVGEADQLTSKASYCVLVSTLDKILGNPTSLPPQLFLLPSTHLADGLCQPGTKTLSSLM